MFLARPGWTGSKEALMGAAIAKPVFENRYAKSRAFAAQVEGILTEVR